MTASRLITVSFYGKLTNGKHHEEKSFSAIANSETIASTEGYAKYAHVPRPQRVALTVLEGYEPMTITVPILFDATTGGTLRVIFKHWNGWVAAGSLSREDSFRPAKALHRWCACKA